MREVDRLTVTTYHTPSLLLMEAAANASLLPAININAQRTLIPDQRLFMSVLLCMSPLLLPEVPGRSRNQVTLQNSKVHASIVEPDFYPCLRSNPILLKGLMPLEEIAVPIHVPLIESRISQN